MKRRRLIERILLVAVVLVVSATVAVFVGYRRMTQNPEALLDIIKNEADMRLDKIHQTAMKNGIREWRLDAESATLVEKDKTMLLTNPQVAFFMNDGDTVHLTAAQGRIFTDSNRLLVQGEVTAHTRLYRFRTESLDYDPATRQLRADTPVDLSGESLSLSAKRMSMDLSTNITRFEGGVEGTIREDLEL